MKGTQPPDVAASGPVLVDLAESFGWRRRAAAGQELPLSDVVVHHEPAIISLLRDILAELRALRGLMEFKP